MQRFPWVSLEIFLWISMEILWISLDFHGFLWTHLHAFPWIPPSPLQSPKLSHFRCWKHPREGDFPPLPPRASRFPANSRLFPAVTDKFTESLYVLANEPSVALFRLQEHVRRSLPELAQHKSDMQSWEEQSQGAIYTVEYACSAIKNMTDSGVYFKSIDSLLKHSIAMKEQLNAAQGRSTATPQAKNPPGTS
ncbi:PREDICTED: protein MEF2BNB isoform X1 [Corvus brachyrhynchos]|uniref:protein MEF2BNB isoform X1 n=1 Tax=Corvus brachyrhynchos TaxID=85066 RepID=UPI0008166400|nr:PREDICTED: protein MEF2BNB isoform X1 [Corvus brachyrhynchos]